MQKEKSSGPLLDRIDLHIEVPSVTYQDLASAKDGTSSALMRDQVLKAREVQAQRFAGPGPKLNARMSSRQLRKYCPLDAESQGRLQTAMDDLGLSAQGHDRILRVARTIADLESSTTIKAEHLTEAIGYVAWIGGFGRGESRLTFLHVLSFEYRQGESNMPMHDWTKVKAGIYHAFHLHWMSALSDALNAGILPEGLYSLPEQFAAGFGPDVLTLQELSQDPNRERIRGGPTTLQTRPKTKYFAEIETAFYLHQQKSIIIRHVSDDEIVAILEIVSPGNKKGNQAFQDFRSKACSLLEHRIHLLIIDPFPPGPRDPNGINSAIWEDLQGEVFHPPLDKPLTLVSYECDLATRAYIEPMAVGDALPDMPLFLEANGCVMVPLEATYQAAFSRIPERWRRVLEANSGETGERGVSAP